MVEAPPSQAGGAGGGRGSRTSGHIPPPEVVVVREGVDPKQPGAHVQLRPLPSGLRGRLIALFAGAKRDAPRRDRYVLDERSATKEVLAGRRRHALVALDPSGRPVLRVLPGMRGELRVGVSVMRVAQMLDDPALRETGTGVTCLALPRGATVRVECGREPIVIQG